ncbi:heme-binding domain-containing protein [Membranihabitans maritimus]|uniref:heme-binding domain-containing protein n=1 Tax=Membranihabitans maritimus TaxID=2904244 RepID=UPI001F2716F4|nr:heme-binding domain-containing protein [Membranihabitans maritimus]
MARKILWILLIALVVIQFIPVNDDIPPYDANDDIFNTEESSTKVQTLVKGACYDCHSYETTYPWYYKIAPVNFWLQDHINHGRDELNFSTWAQYPADRAAHKAEEAVELIEDKEMPLTSYTWVHKNARLSEDQRMTLVGFFKELQQQGGH